MRDEVGLGGMRWYKGVLGVISWVEVARGCWRLKNQPYHILKTNIFLKRCQSLVYVFHIYFLIIC